MKVFFATDIHGSEICWRKFLNAAAFYKADMVILGGDVTGKVLVPVQAMPGYWEVSFGGQRMRLETKTELDEIQRKIRDRGSYPSVMAPEELRALASYCERTGVQLVSDEIYHGISSAGSPATSSAWSTSREAIVVNSFSKYFSMTGWRLGWLLMPPRLLRAADCLAGNFTVCPPALAQQAALGAFEESSYAEADSHVARYAVNRGLLLDGLARLGITRLAPADGAFYVYADVAHLTSDSMDLTYRLLADIGVAVAPGLDFDPVDGGRWIRLSCAGATADVEEALHRLGEWLSRTGSPAHDDRHHR